MTAYRHRAKETSTVVLYKFNDNLDDVVAVADLFDAFNVQWELRLNEIGTASFYLPLDDPFLAEIQAAETEARFVEISEDGTRIELFRVWKIRKLRSSKDAVRVDCLHVLDTLNDKTMKGVHTATGTGTALAYLIAQQDLAAWALGTNDFSRSFLHTWTNRTILEALYSIPGRWGDQDVVISWDTTVFPWTLNFETPDDTVTALLHYGKNAQLLERIANMGEVVSRLYAYGQGAGTDQLTIASENVTGNVEGITATADAGQKDVAVVDGTSFSPGDHLYIEDGSLWEINEIDSIAVNVLTMVDNLLHEYTGTGSVSEAEEYIQDDALWTAGIRVTRIFEDQRYTDAANLKGAADAILVDRSTARVTYTGEAEDISRATGLDTPKFELGKIVRVYDPKLGKDVDVRVIVMRRPDVDGKPGEIELQLSNSLDEFPGFGDAAYAADLDGIGSGSVFGRILHTSIENGKIILSETVGDVDFSDVVNAGDLYDMSRTPGVSSLYLSATYLGYYLGGTGWRAYIKGDGTFKFYGDASNYIEWNGATCTIKGALDADDITAGTLSATYISGGTLNFAAISRSALAILTSEIGAGQVTPGLTNFSSNLGFSGGDLFNVDGIRGYTGTSSYWIDLRNHQWFGYNTSSYLYLGQDVSLRGSRDATIDAQGGDIYFRKGSTAKRIYWYDFQLYSGKSGLNLYAPHTYNGTDYFVRLYQ